MRCNRAASSFARPQGFSVTHLVLHVTVLVVPMQMQQLQLQRQVQAQMQRQIQAQQAALQAQLLEAQQAAQQAQQQAAQFQRAATEVCFCISSCCNALPESLELLWHTQMQFTIKEPVPSRVQSTALLFSCPLVVVFLPKTNIMLVCRLRLRQLQRQRQGGGLKRKHAGQLLASRRHLPQITPTQSSNNRGRSSTRRQLPLPRCALPAPLLLIASFPNSFTTLLRHFCTRCFEISQAKRSHCNVFSSRADVSMSKQCILCDGLD